MSDIDELKVFKAIEPVGVCAICKVVFYPHSKDCLHPYNLVDCPLHGDEWRHYQYERSMQFPGIS